MWNCVRVWRPGETPQALREDTHANELSLPGEVHQGARRGLWLLVIGVSHDATRTCIKVRL